MSLRSYLDLKSGMTVETFTEKWGKRVYIGHSKGVSAFFDSPQALRKFLKLPVKTPSRDRLDAWLAELETMDRGGLSADRGELSADRGELAATGFGPEHHGDEDPTKDTRMIT
jgi:hypothetical protein